MRRLLPVLLALVCACDGCHDTVAGGTDAAADAKPRDAARDVGGGDVEVEAGPTDDALPPSGSAELSTRGRHLLEAIAQDNADLATDILFPRDAWTQARDGQDPSKQWDQKIKPGFASAIHTWAKKDMARAQFVSFEIGKTVQQIEPKKKEWKKPLWQVKHSKLMFTVDGQARHLEVAEMVGWRGAWYVVHLR